MSAQPHHLIEAGAARALRNGLITADEAVAAVAEARTPLHAVYASVHTPHGAVTFRVGQPTTWDKAQDRWRRLDDRRIAGRRQTVRHDGRRYTLPGVLADGPAGTWGTFFEVRAVDRFGRGLGGERHEHALVVPYRALRVAS